MAIFLTQYHNIRGRLWCGPDIRARTWRRANIQCWLLRVITFRPSLRILGVLVERIVARELNDFYFPTDDRELFPPPEDDVDDKERIGRVHQMHCL